MPHVRNMTFISINTQKLYKYLTEEEEVGQMLRFHSSGYQAGCWQQFHIINIHRVQIHEEAETRMKVVISFLQQTPTLRTMNC